MSEAQQGLIVKYNVTKVADGSTVHNCFVLRPEKDPHARAALRAYAESVRGENSLLWFDLTGWLHAIEQGPQDEPQRVPVCVSCGLVEVPKAGEACCIECEDTMRVSAGMEPMTMRQQEDWLSRTKPGYAEEAGS